MSTLQVEFCVTPDQLELAEASLFELGCQAVSLISDTDEPVLEPAPGETPLWDSVTVRAWFPLDTDFANLRLALREYLPDVECRIEFVGDNDWQSEVGNQAVEQLFAGRLQLMPKNRKGLQVPQGIVPLYLEPGLAFGSGSHPTTQLCLEWLASSLDTPGVKVLDFGCGSGILSVAAALLGARVTAVDHDPQAVVATLENAEYNGVAECCQVLSLQQWQKTASQYTGKFDVVVANILAQPLIELADLFERVCRDGALIVLSGILQEQADAVAQAYRQTDFHRPVQRDEWVRLQGTCRKLS